jgi:hypothetical protein
MEYPAIPCGYEAVQWGRASAQRVGKSRRVFSLPSLLDLHPGQLLSRLFLRGKEIPAALPVDSCALDDILRSCRMMVFDDTQLGPSHA